MTSTRALAASLLLCAAALGACSQHKEDRDNDVQVALADLPAPVRATLEREAAGGKVGEIEKEVKHGRTVYSADATVNGKDWDIVIDEAGNLVSKERD